MRHSSSLILIAPLLAAWVAARAGMPAATVAPGEPIARAAAPAAQTAASRAGMPTTGTPAVHTDTPAQTATPPPAAPAATPRAPAHARPRGKYAAPVNLHFSVPAHLTANIPIELSVEVTPGIDADELLVEWVPSAGLALAAADNPLRLEAVKQGRTYQSTLSLTTPADGEYRLGAVVTLKTGTGRQTRAFSQRLQVGTPVARSKAALTRDARHTLIEATPAQESVSKQ